MAEPVVAARAPKRVMVEAGKTYWWCACGRSQNQPFCDGSHKGTDFTPMVWEAAETREVSFCQCKRSGKAPLCDGTHRSLP